MTRTVFLFIGILCFGLSIGQNQKKNQRPNIILLLADDMGIGDVAAYGFNNEIKTPSLDNMAENGLRFDRFYAQAPDCSPTRGSYLTSRHPFRY